MLWTMLYTHDDLYVYRYTSPAIDWYQIVNVDMIAIVIPYQPLYTLAWLTRSHLP